jgi:hypothetical protein
MATGASARCWSTAEVRAQKVLELRTMMMVGALQCGFDPTLQVRENHNLFVRNLRTTIQAQELMVKRRFGAGFDRHKTRMANAYSTVEGQVAFCQQVSGLAREAAALKAADLPSYADNRIEKTRIVLAPCPK